MVSEAQKRATNKYLKSHYGQIAVRLDHALVDDFKQALAANGETLTGWLKARMVEYIEQHKNV